MRRYTWNASITSGLAAPENKYIQGGSPEMVGAGGTHEWTIRATGKGEQQFTAAYERPWEPLRATGALSCSRLT